MHCRQILLDYIYIVENNKFTFDAESIAKRRTKALINQYFEQFPDLKDELIVKELGYLCEKMHNHNEQSIIDYIYELDRQNYFDLIEKMLLYLKNKFEDIYYMIYCVNLYLNIL